VLHAWWGLVSDFMHVCHRLADEGFLAVAPDLVEGRVAETSEAAEELVRACSTAQTLLVVAATVAWVLDQPELAPRRVGLVGYSLGASVALRAAAGGIGDGVVLFYGTTSPRHVGGLKVPVMGHFAATDDYEPAEAVDALFHQPARQGVRARRFTYPGTSHWFCEPQRAAYHEQAAEFAWSRTVGFLRDCLGGSA